MSLSLPHSLKRTKSFPTDFQTVRFLYTILKQLDLKPVDWNVVAQQLEITNGHAARMRFSRFKAAFEGTPDGRGAGKKKENGNGNGNGNGEAGGRGKEKRGEKRGRYDGDDRQSQEQGQFERQGGDLGGFVAGGMNDMGFIKAEELVKDREKRVKFEEPDKMFPMMPATVTMPSLPVSPFMQRGDHVVVKSEESQRGNRAYTDGLVANSFGGLSRQTPMTYQSSNPSSTIHHIDNPYAFLPPTVAMADLHITPPHLQMLHGSDQQQGMQTGNMQGQTQAQHTYVMQRPYDCVWQPSVPTNQVAHRTHSNMSEMDRFALQSSGVSSPTPRFVAGYNQQQQPQYFPRSSGTAIKLEESLPEACLTFNDPYLPSLPSVQQDVPSGQTGQNDPAFAKAFRQTGAADQAVLTPNLALAEPVLPPITSDPSHTEGDDTAKVRIKSEFHVDDLLQNEKISIKQESKEYEM